MFIHAYDGYMRHAFPLDELKPISCSGSNTLGGYSLTLLDALDSLVVFGNMTEFRKQVLWVQQSLNFDIDRNVSVFETNIRILGGLLSSHLLAVEYISDYDNGLLRLAIDLAERLLPAFNTPTGIPYGTVNLRHGVPPGETPITATATGGTVALEFGVLSRLTGDSRFEKAAKRAAKALWQRRSTKGLLGGHINALTGEWTEHTASIAGNSDSFFEYLIKAALLFNDGEYRAIFRDAYAAVNQTMRVGPWYSRVNMVTAAPISVDFESLQAFWPGMQTLIGDLQPAKETMHAFQSVWRQFGFVPELYSLTDQRVRAPQYPLRPEMVESLYYLAQATDVDVWRRYGVEIVDSLNTRARADCGFAAVENVQTGELRDHMDSFFLSETCKYLFLLFDPDNFINRRQYIFNTEGHPLPMRRDWLRPLDDCAPVESAHCQFVAFSRTDFSADQRTSGQPSAPRVLTRTIYSEHFDPNIVLLTIGALTPLTFYGALASFGKLQEDQTITAELFFAEPLEACTPLLNVPQVRGRVAVVRRGQCPFALKAVNAYTAGAVALLVIDNNNASHELVTMTNDPEYPASEVNVPAAFVSGIDGQILMPTLLRNTAAVRITIEHNSRKPPAPTSNLERLTTHLQRGSKKQPLMLFELPLTFQPTKPAEPTPVGVVILHAPTP